MVGQQVRCRFLDYELTESLLFIQNPTNSWGCLGMMKSPHDMSTALCTVLWCRINHYIYDARHSVLKSSWFENCAPEGHGRDRRLSCDSISFDHSIHLPALWRRAAIGPSAVDCARPFAINLRR
jgi:hypothetical protein